MTELNRWPNSWGLVTPFNHPDFLTDPSIHASAQARLPPARPDDEQQKTKTFIENWRLGDTPLFVGTIEKEMTP